MGARHGPSARPWQSASMPSTPGVCGKNFTDSVHQAHYKWHSQEHHGLLASLGKGQVVPVEVFRAPGSISSRGGPPPCHRRRAAATTCLAETSWSTKIYLAESDRWRRSAPELPGPHGLEEGKGKGYLTSSRQYGNALLGVRHQEEEEEVWEKKHWKMERHKGHDFMTSSVWRHTDPWRRRSCDYSKQHTWLPSSIETKSVSRLVFEILSFDVTQPGSTICVDRLDTLCSRWLCYNKELWKISHVEGCDVTTVTS